MVTVNCGSDYLTSVEPDIMEWWYVAGLIITVYTFTILYLQIRNPEKHLNWDNIDLTDVDFPSAFAWGVATASHQIEGHNQNNWTQFENSKELERSGEACDHWNRWKNDFELIENLGVGHYRFSIEWSRIEPKMGTWDDTVISQYSAMIDDLLEKNITPMVTLHHFSHPIWFEEMGGFTIRENVNLWVRFSEKMFAELGDRVKWWCTINEPAVFTSMGYVLGEFPPGKRSFKLTKAVSRNMMIAHAQCLSLIHI